MIKEVPNGLLWYFDSDALRKKKYIKDLEFIKEHTECNYVMLRGEPGVEFGNLQQSHPVVKEIVEHAHEIGLKVMLHIAPSPGFLNSPPNPVPGTPPEVDQAQVYHVPDPKRTDAITRDYEMTADENGFVEFTHKPKWSRPKLAPLFGEVLKVYAFEKTGEGFYKKDTLMDITDRVNIINSRTDELEIEIYAGKENAGKTIFAIVAQYYNYTEAGEPQWQRCKYILDSYADIPLDGFGLDEFGMSYLNAYGVHEGLEEPFRGRRYSVGMNQYYQEVLGLDLKRLLFDMRYAPEAQEAVRIKAINIYFEKLRYFPLYTELRVAEYAKELYGQDIYIGVHNTFHNRLDNDEIWTTACNWWDLPREYGHTDESICFPVRMGVMLAAKNPIMIDTYYTRVKETTYDHIVEGAPFGCREFHHAYCDFRWGQSWTEPEFLEKTAKLDREVARLNVFQTEYPRFDLLVIFGSPAQNNWYPDYEARNIYDVDGKMQIVPKCDEIWKAGYRCALAPDYAIDDGRITLDGDKICFNGHPFTHCLFLYPKYAKRETYEFLNLAGKNGVKIAAVGRADIDFDGSPASLTIPCFAEYDLSILEKLGCNKSAIPYGCIYHDGSFSLVSLGILTGETQEFDFEVDGIRYTGFHTGLLAYRKGKFAFATAGSELLVNGEKCLLSVK